MKVSEAIALLQTLPQDAILVLAKDAEGNGFEEFADFGLGWWEDGEYSSWQTDEDGEESYPEKGHTAETCNAVCLWP